MFLVYKITYGVQHIQHEIEKLSECQFLKEDCPVRLVSDCFFIILTSNTLGPFLPANQYQYLL